MTTLRLYIAITKALLVTEAFSAMQPVAFVRRDSLWQKADVGAEGKWLPPLQILRLSASLFFRSLGQDKKALVSISIYISLNTFGLILYQILYL